MGQTIVQVIQYRCERCGYTWQPARPQLPKVCSRCKSYEWNVPKGEVRLPDAVGPTR